MAQEVTEEERRQKLLEFRSGGRPKRQSVPDLSRTPSFLLWQSQTFKRSKSQDNFVAYGRFADEKPRPLESPHAHGAAGSLLSLVLRDVDCRALADDSSVPGAGGSHLMHSFTTPASVLAQQAHSHLSQPLQPLPSLPGQLDPEPMSPLSPLSPLTPLSPPGNPAGNAAGSAAARQSDSPIGGAAGSAGGARRSIIGSRSSVGSVTSFGPLSPQQQGATPVGKRSSLTFALPVAVGDEEAHRIVAALPLSLTPAGADRPAPSPLPRSSPPPGAGPSLGTQGSNSNRRSLGAGGLSGSGSSLLSAESKLGAAAAGAGGAATGGRAPGSLAPPSDGNAHQAKKSARSARVRTHTGAFRV